MMYLKQQVLNDKGFLVTVDIEKAFDQVVHSLLSAVLQKYGLGKRFLKRTQILIKNQESYVVHIKGLDIYGHKFLYTAYPDDRAFFFKNKKSVIEAFKILDEFFFFLWAKAE